jgi:plasmid stabilization system protein ParE
MTYRLHIDPRAEQEIADAATSYEATRPGYGPLFLTDIDHVVALLIAAPKLYQRVDDELRRAVLRRFPYNLYYRVRDPERLVEVIGCAHGRADTAVLIAELSGRVG